MVHVLRRWYRWFVLRRMRLKARFQGEILFDKYERDGAYHWGFYYGDGAPDYRLLMDAVVPMVPPGGRVLDIGCGDGLLAHLLAEKNGCRVTGVDLHPLAIAYAREKNRGANVFAVGSAYECGEAAAFDSVVAIEVLEHLAHPERLVANAFRVLKAGGTFVVSTPLARPDRPQSAYHIREYTEKELTSLLATAFAAWDLRHVTGSETIMLCRCTKP